MLLYLPTYMYYNFGLQIAVQLGMWDVRSFLSDSFKY